jgi:hypothetical protein
MGALLEKLWKVQQLQSELYDARRERVRLTTRLADRRKKLDDLRAALAAKREEVKRKQVEMRTCETDAKARQEQIQGLRTKLNMCRNQRDYGALLSEIATAEADNGRLTERYIKIDEELKVLSKQVVEWEGALQVEEGTVAALDADITARLAELEKRLQGLDAKRNGELTGIPSDARKVFDRLSDRFDGQAMVVIELVDQDENIYACSNCNMSLISGITSAVFSTDEVKTCPTCSRILYYQA